MSTNETQPVDCFVCRKHRGEISIPGGAIYEDDLLYAGHISIPAGQAIVYLGWLVAETRRHVPEMADLTDAEAQALGLLIARLSRALMISEQAEHVYVFVFGDAVRHVHVHVMPRYPGAPREYWGVRVDEWPAAPRGGAQAMADVCARLRAYLRGD